MSIKAITDFYGIRESHYEILFPKKSATDAERLEVVDTLVQSLKMGNLNSLDMLVNISLKNDVVGNTAETKLYELWCKKSDGYIDIANQIKKAYQALYGSYLTFKEDRIQNNKPENTDWVKFTRPSKLLFIAGYDQTMDIKRDIVKIFKDKFIKIYDPSNVGIDVDLWANDRFFNAAEVDTVLHTWTAENAKFTIGSSMNRVLALEQQESIIKNNPAAEINIVPICEGEHFSVIVIYKNRVTGKKDALYFSSLRYKDGMIGGNKIERINEKEVEDNIRRSVQNIGVVHFFTDELQGNRPNGCGPLVLSAVEHIIEHDDKHPVVVIKEFVDKLLKEPEYKQEDGLMSLRYRYCGIMIDSENKTDENIASGG